MKHKKELCKCGHLGGMSPNGCNSHSDRYQKGHGKCNECDCKQFTWVRFVD